MPVVFDINLETKLQAFCFESLGQNVKTLYLGANEACFHSSLFLVLFFIKPLRVFLDDKKILIYLNRDLQW